MSRKLITFPERAIALLEAAAPPVRSRAAGDYLGALLVQRHVRWTDALGFLGKVPRADLAAFLAAHDGRVTTVGDRLVGMAVLVQRWQRSSQLSELWRDACAMVALCDLVDEYTAGNAALRKELESD